MSTTTIMMDWQHQDIHQPDEQTNALQLNNEAAELIESNRLFDALSLLSTSSNQAADATVRNSNDDKSLLHPRDETPTGQPIDDIFIYDEGMSTFSKPFSLDESDADSCPCSYASVCILITMNYNRGLIYRRLLREDKAVECFRQACNESAKLLEGPHSFLALDGTMIPDVVSIAHNIAHSHYRLGQLEQALALYNEALVLAQGLYGEKSYYTVRGLNCLGVVYYHLQLNDEAEKSLVQALSILKQATGTTTSTIDCATIMHNLGRVYHAKREYELALKAYDQAMTTRLSFLGADNLDVAQVYCSAAEASHQLKQFDEALQLYSNFLQIATRKLDPNHVGIAMVHKCMADIHLERKQYQISIEYYFRSLEMVQETFEEGHSEVIIILNKIAFVHFELEQFDSAILVLQRCLSIEQRYRSGHGDESSRVLAVLMNIGIIHKKKGDNQSFINTQYEILHVQKKLMTQDNEKFIVIETLVNIGKLHYECSQLSKAVVVLDEALELQLQLLDEHHLDISNTRFMIGVIKIRQKEFSAAIEHLKKSMHIQQNSWETYRSNSDICPQQIIHCIQIMTNLAAAYVQVEDTTNGLEFYEKTLLLHTSLPENSYEDIHTIQILQDISNVHKVRGEFDKAISYLEEAVEISVDKTFGDDHEDEIQEVKRQFQIAQLFNQIGNLYLRGGATEKAMKCFECTFRTNSSSVIIEKETLVARYSSKLEPKSNCAAAA